MAETYESTLGRFRGWISEAAARARFEANERLVRRDFWRKLRQAMGRFPLAEEAVAAYYCALDRNTRARVRMLLLAALAYFILPFDLVPDIVAGLGYTDDITVLLTLFNLLSAHITPEHREAARRALLKDEDPSGEAADRPTAQTGSA